MTIYDYKDPIIAQMRSGLPDDPYVPITEQFKIIKNMVILTEIPDEFTGVSVSGEGVTWIENKTGVLAEHEYHVDYTLGVVRFHPSKEGLTPTFNYLGRGAFFFPASRVWSLQIDGSVTETLEIIIEAAHNFVHKGDYDPTVAYKFRNIVNYQGGTYMCIVDTTPGIDPTNTSHWRKITSFVFRGVYSPTATYTHGDFVVDEAREKLYMCVVNSSTGDPLTDASKWKLSIDISPIIANAVQATNNANAAADNANQAAINANNAANNANEKADLANQAADNANQAADNANEKANLANDAAINANNAANEANIAADNANTAAANANIARDEANTAAINANNAATLANQAATNANNAADNANEKADLANTAATNANDKANYAQTQGDYAKAQGDYASNQGQSIQWIIDNTKAVGDYDPSVTYQPNNIVYFNGSSYIAMTQVTGVTPGTDDTKWQLIARRGENGTGSGTVLSVTSTNEDIIVTDPTEYPKLTLNSGTGPNQIVKRDSLGGISSNSLVMGNYKIEFNSLDNSIDFVYIGT